MPHSLKRPPLYGLIAPDGSSAEVDSAEDRECRYIEERGPRRLWTLVEEAYRVREAHDRPNWARFAATATRRRQYAWFKNPDRARVETPELRVLTDRLRVGSASG